MQWRRAASPSNADRDHVLLDASPSLAGVKTVLDDVAKPRVETELKLDVRIRLQHRPQLGPDHARQRVI